MEPRHDGTQDRDCERSQPVSRPAGYGRDVDRGDRDEPIELACRWHCSWCRAPTAEETCDRRARIAQAVEPLACGGRKERPPDHAHRRGVRGRTRRLLAGALARCTGHRGPCQSCVERRGDARAPPGEDRSARHGASQARLSRLAARRARTLQDGSGADACRGGRQAAEPGPRDAGCEASRIITRVKAAFVRLGIRRFNPKLKTAAAGLEALRTPEGEPIPPNTLAALKRDLERHRIVKQQIREIEQTRLERLGKAPAEGSHAMVRLLARVIGIGVETADMLLQEVLSRNMRDRRAVARYAGLAGSPDESGAKRREKGLARSGTARVRRGMIQLAWRFLMFQKDSAL